MIVVRETNNIKPKMNGMQSSNRVAIIAVVLASTLNLAFAQDDDSIRDYWYINPEDVPDTSEEWKTFLNNEASRTHPINPLDFCSGIQCQFSALNVKQKERFYTVINNGRHNYVYDPQTWGSGKYNILSDSFSNVFHATWDEEIAAYAQQKAALCRNLSFNLHYLHKGPLQPHWNLHPDRYPSDATCLVQANRFFTKINDYSLNRSDIPKGIAYNFLDREHIFEGKIYKSRLYIAAASYGYGCGVIVRKTETEYVEDVLCYLCPAVTWNLYPDYLPRNGTPCSKCKGYFGLKDIYCTTDKDPKQAKLIGKKFTGLCSTDAINNYAFTDKFVSTLYSFDDCPYGYLTTPTPKISTPTTITFTPPESEDVSKEIAPVELKTKQLLTCFTCVHMFALSLWAICMLYVNFLSPNKLERDTSIELDDDGDDNET